MQERSAEAKTRVVCFKETSDRLHIDEGKKSKLVEAMWDCIQPVENHSKRNNVRLLSLKETLGTNGTLLSCVQKILTEGIGVCVNESEIERAHRPLTPMPDLDQPPRLVLIWFLRQSVSDKVVTETKENLCMDEPQTCSVNFVGVEMDLVEL